MIEPTMLYKWPGKHHIHNDRFDYIIVDRCDVNIYITDGWSLTTEAAKANGSTSSSDDKASISEPGDDRPTRSELEQKAAELGIRLHGRMTNKTITHLIEARLNANQTPNN